MPPLSRVPALPASVTPLRGCRISATPPRSRRCSGRGVAARVSLMLPLSDGLPARRFPIVNVSLIVANFAVWIFYELPHLNSSVLHASFYPCPVAGTCHGAEPL